MNTIPANPLLGVGLHGVGAMAAANCYAPQKFVRRWSWEIYWLTQAAWCWLLWPVIGAWLTIPHLAAVLTEAPKEAMLKSFALGVAYGVGGTAFNLSIRYIGFALTYAIAVGLSSVAGTLLVPWCDGTLGEKLSGPGAAWLIAGVTIGALGIAVCGLAGRWKELDLRTAGDTGGFSLVKGLALSLLAGILSAVYNFALNAANPVVDVAVEYGAGQWKGNVAYLFANSGAFVTAATYSLVLARKNRSLGELVRLPESPSAGRLAWNYFLAFLTGTLWYGQFFFYNLGHVRLGADYDFSSWAIHMIMLVLFSNVLGVLLKEWRGSQRRTYAAVGVGLAVLLAAVLSLTYGNYLGGG
jgi:L-rhamnose-H+ transport protein